jgi:hypothetical protein
MNRLLACILCCATLLPAAAVAQAGDHEGGWRPNHPASPRHFERTQLDLGCCERAPIRHKGFSRTDFFIRGGYALGTEDGGWNGWTDGYYGSRGNDGGVALEAGFRYWLTRDLGIGLAAGYTDLGRNRRDGGIMVPVGSGDGNTIDAPYYDGRNSRLSAFPVTVQVTYRAPVRGPVRPYAEIGAGVYTLRGPEQYPYVYATDTPPTTGARDSLAQGGLYYPNYYNSRVSQSVHLGLLGGAGMELRASRHLGVTLGARWNLVSANYESYNHATFLAGLVLR